MNQRNARMAFPLLASLLLAGPAGAQDIGKDVPPGHWAFEAVQDLAAKGLIKGYPPDNNFLGQRVLTRYEVATLVKRVLDKMDDLMKNSGANKEEYNRLLASVEEIRKLADGFKVELTVIGQDMEKVKTELSALSGRVDALEKKAGDLDAKMSTFDQRIVDANKKADQANLLSDQALANINELKSNLNDTLANKADVGKAKGSSKLQIGSLFQIWYGHPFGRTLGGNTPTPYSSTPPGRNFGGGVGDTGRLRRVELAAYGDLLPGRGAYRVGRVDYRLMFDLARVTGLNTTTATVNGVKVVSSVSTNPNSHLLQDAFIGYQVAPRFRIEVGQQKTGLSEEGNRSSSQLLTIERSFMNNLPATVGRFGDIRDFGFVLKYQGTPVDAQVGIWQDNGATQNTVDTDRQKFLAFNAFYKGIPHLLLGVYGGTNVDQTSPNSARDRAGAAVLWQSGPDFLEAEFGYAQDRALGAPQGAFSLGGYLLYAHTLSRKWQLVGRFDEWDPVVHGGTTTTGVAVPSTGHNIREYTIGVNYYIRGHNAKIQSNYIIDDVQGGGISFFGIRRSLWLTNFQVAF